jgi:hypothetical protein
LIAQAIVDGVVPGEVSLFNPERFIGVRSVTH